MARIKKWIIEFTWYFGASVGSMYIIYYCTGWKWFDLKLDQVFFFAGFSAISATDAVMPIWRIKSYWRLKSKESFGNTYTKYFHVEKRVATFFWRKWYATQDEERATELFESLKNNF